MPTKPQLLTEEALAEIETINQGCRYPYVDALCQTVRALRAEIARLNTCAWCGVEMERMPVDGGDELACTSEQCPSFGIGVWCYADSLSRENAALRDQLAQAQAENNRLAQHTKDLEHDFNAAIQERNEHHTN